MNRILCISILVGLALRNIDGAIDALPPCNKGWVPLGSENCYWFERRTPEPWKKAGEACRSIGGHLISLEHLQEAERISKYLKQEDLTRSEWLTSGVHRDGVWEWEGVGGLVRFPFWTHPPPSLHNPFVVFSYHNNAYKWKAKSDNKPYPYICEQSRIAHRQKYQIEAPENFGRNPNEIRKKLERPQFLQEPEDAIFYHRGSDTFVTLKCSASGNPEPLIKWFRGDSGEEINLNGQSEKLRIGGNLVFLSISQEDYGSYYCMASNSLGTLRSRKAFVRYAFVKKFSQKRLDIYATSGLGKSISCLEPDHYPRSLGFTWMVESVKSFQHQSERVLISRDGTLYFSYLETSDQNLYSCNIVSNELQSGHYGPFFKLQVSESQAGVPKNFRPQIPGEFLKIFPEKPQLGEPVYIECFAYGKPSPKIHWERLENGMPRNIEISSYNRVLYFPSFSPDDQGTYRCTASNSIGSTAKQITLTLNTPPKLLTGLGDQTADQGTAINFSCQVFGQPEPDFEWFFNGSPINPLLLSLQDQGRIEVAGDRLTIRGAKHRDSGIYQCIATNSLGKANSAGYLSIRNFKPNFDQFSKSAKVYATSGKSTELNCKPNASPAALVSWLHDRKTLGYDSRISLNPNGALRISNVKPEDAGQYICSASSSFGTNSRILNLVVLDEFVAKVKPAEEIEVEYGSNTRLSCTSSQGSTCGPSKPNPCPEAGFSWTFNGEPIGSLPQFPSPGYGLGWSELNLRNVRQHLEGVYMCRIDTMAGHLSNTVTLRVDKPPRSPIRLEIGGISSRSVKLSWTMPSNPVGVFQDELDAFRVEYFQMDPKISPNESEWRMLIESVPAVHPVVSDYVVEGLTPFSQVQFRVSAHNFAGWSQPSRPSKLIKTLPSEPTSVVEGIAISSLNLGDILVTWKPLKQSDWNDAKVGYMVEAGPLSNASIFEEEMTFKIAIENPIANSIVIDARKASLNECTPFEVSVTPFNSQGKGPVSDPVEMKGTFRGGADPVRNLSGFSINSTHAIFFWEWKDSPSNTSCTAIISGFMVSCAPISSFSAEETVDLIPFSGNSYNWTVGGLSPGISYKCTVTVLTGGGIKGASSDPIPVKTYLSAPQNGVSELFAMQDEDEESLRMDWTPVKVGSEEEPLIGYKLVVYSGATSNRGVELDIPVSLLDRPSSPSIKIEGLELMKFYRSQIQPYSRGGLGPKTRQLKFRFGARRLTAGAASQTNSSFQLFSVLLLFMFLLFSNL